MFVGCMYGLCDLFLVFDLFVGLDVWCVGIVDVLWCD